MRLRPIAVSWWLMFSVGLGLSSCGGLPADDSLEGDDVEVVRQAFTAAQSVQNPIERPSGARGEYRLEQAWEPKLRTSWASVDAFAGRAGASYDIRTVCPNGVESDDSSLYVSSYYRRAGSARKWWREGLFNDDCSTADAECACPRCSLVRIEGVPDQGLFVEVRAFTATRAQAYCSVQYKRSTSTVWTTLRPFTWLGGRLVNVGPVARGANQDYFEIFSPDHGGAPAAKGTFATNTDTDLFLFDVGTATEPTAGTTATFSSHYVPASGTDRSSSDYDPSLRDLGTARFPGRSGRPDNLHHYLLVRKERAPPASPPLTPADLEATVSLHRGNETNAWNIPHEGLTMPAPNAGSCSDQVMLAPGRYAARLRASTFSPVGDRAELSNPACSIIRSDGVPPAYDYGDDPECSAGRYDRGIGNQLAFRMHIETSADPLDPPSNPVASDRGRHRGAADVRGGRRPPARWSTVHSRDVPLGAFGCDEDNDPARCSSSFLLAFEVTERGRRYRLCVDSRSPNATFDDNLVVYFERDPMFAEFKVATLNTHHEHHAISELKNTSDLLASRGFLDLPGGRVREFSYHGPFQWDADVVALQEISNENPSGETNAFIDNARANSSMDWAYQREETKKQTKLQVGYRSWSATYINDRLIRYDGEGRQAIWPATPPGQSQCFDDRCEVYDNDSGDFRNWAIVTRLDFKFEGARAEGPSRPIAFVNAILEPGDGGCLFGLVCEDRAHNAKARLYELDSLLEALEGYLADDPYMFNGFGSTDPKHFDNRIIIAGDLNIYAHEIGEHYWFVRRLRERFGWAVDAAMAVPDSAALMLGMHNRGHYQSVGNPSPFTGILHYGFGCASGSYFQCMSGSDPDKWWWGDTGSDADWPHHFPYWARTYRGAQGDIDQNGSFERHDVVLLAGYGWKDADVVADYVVMNGDTAYDSPFAVYAGGRRLAVDLNENNLDHDQDDVPNSPTCAVKHYRPRFNDWTAADGNTECGSAAIDSDHRPVGVRLRIR